MNFQELRAANRARQAEWPGSDQADLAFRALEVAGEAGEVAEAVKKYLRARRGIGGSTAGVDAITDELADVVIAVDLLADLLGVNLSASVVRKFNKTSGKYGLQTRMAVRP